MSCVLIGNLSCAPFRDSVFSDQLFRSERNLNDVGLSRISNVDGDGVIRIAVLADSHQNYRDMDRVVHQLNAVSGVDFVVNLGDFTNNGYNMEYDQFIDSYVSIQAPTLAVIGNHDAIGAGPALFSKAFGKSNFWFESNNKRFIFFHSANFENPDGFDPQWLLSAVQSSSKPVIVFSHINFRDSERYFGPDAQILNQVIQHANTQMILNGHNHEYRITDDNGTVMLEAPRVEGAQWLMLEIQDHQAQVIRMENGTSVWAHFKN